MMTKERRPAIRTLRGWTIGILHEAGAIRECEEHGWAQDCAGRHARDRDFDIARQDSPAGISPEAAVVEFREVLDTIGGSCQECLPGLGRVGALRGSPGLGRRLFRQLRPLATTDDPHTAIGRGPIVRLCRLPVTRLSLELLRPTSLETIDDVARQIQSSHVGDPCETARQSLGRRAGRFGPELGGGSLIQRANGFQGPFSATEG